MGQNLHENMENRHLRNFLVYKGLHISTFMILKHVASKVCSGTV